MNDSVLHMKLKNCPPIYREELTIPKNINFGLELELDNIKFNETYKLIKRNFDAKWSILIDKSLTEGKNAEIATPVLQNNPSTWILLNKLSKLLIHLNPSYNKCSFQVNFDGDLLPTIKDKANFIKLFAMYEDIIYKFSKGEDANYRDSLEIYASPILLSVKGIMMYGDEEVVELFSEQKKYGIAFKTMYQDLIEFRTPNMTNNPILWQNYISTFYYLLKFSCSSKYNVKEAEDYISNFNRTSPLKEYERENKEKALTLCKSIFNNDQDICSFMHQYLKIKK